MLQIQVLHAHTHVELRGFVLLLVVVILSAYVGGIGPGLLSTFLAAGLMSRLLVSSTNGWQIMGRDDGWQWATFIASGILCGALIERHHHRQRQRSASRRIRDATLSNVGDGLITTDELGKCTFLNREAERLTGWKNYQAVGRPIGDVIKTIDEATRESEEDPIQKIQRVGATTAVIGHTLLVNKDGCELPIAESAAPIMSPDGRLEGFVLVFRDASKIRMAEAELQKRIELQEQVARIVDSAPAVIYSFRKRPDGTTCFPFASPKIETILGVSREDLARDGGRGFARIHPDDLHHVLAAIDESARNMDVWHCEFRASSITGDEVWLSGRSVPTKEGDGSILWYGFMDDITERKHSEYRLQLLTTALEAAANAVVLVDSSGRIVWVNAAFTGMTGYSSSEALGQNPRILKSGVHPQSFYKNMWSTLQKSEVWSGEIVNRRKDGTDYTEQMTITPVLDDRGVTTHFIAIKQDITQQRMAEESIRLNEERLRLAQQAAELGVFEVELPSGKLTWSLEMFGIFGLCPDGPQPRPDEVLAMFHPDDRTQLQEQYALGAIGKRLQIECRIVRPNGEMRWVELSGKAILDKAGRLIRYLGVCRDVTEREKLESHYRQSQKMEAVGRLAGGVAHDFNNILMVIVGYGDLLKEQFATDERPREMIEQILKAANRAASLTHQLLTFSRQQTVAPKITDLNDILIEMSTMLTRLIGENIELTLALGEDLSRVMVDAGLMQQVFMNLVVNARDAMPDGGKLIIETANTNWDEEAVRISEVETKPGSFVLLSVTDNGIGMDEHTRSHLFEPFFTTKGIGKGTGLGLTIVYAAVKQSGGFILVLSEPGRGTTFKIYIPSIEQSGTMTSVPKDLVRNFGGSETILLVEDEDAVRSAIRYFLLSRGYTVLEASTPGVAISVAHQHQDRIHLLISDVLMPEMNGQELAKRLKISRPGIRVLFISGYSDLEINLNAEGHADFLQKPFDFDLLGRKVRDILEH